MELGHGKISGEIRSKYCVKKGEGKKLNVMSPTVCFLAGFCHRLFFGGILSSLVASDYSQDKRDWGRQGSEVPDLPLSRPPRLSAWPAGDLGCVDLVV